MSLAGPVILFKPKYAGEVDEAIGGMIHFLEMVSSGCLVMWCPMRNGNNWAVGGR